MRYKKAFEKCKDKKTTAFIPFVTLGDTNYESSFEIIKTLISCKVDALELGFAFSDPVADGVVIQKAAKRALDNGANTEDNFALLQKIRNYDEDMPIGLLLYANLVVAYGIEEFYKKAYEVGVDSILIADVPLNESEVFEKFAKKYNIEQIFVASSSASDETLEKIAKKSQAYIYTLAQAGVTGVPLNGKIQGKEVITTLKSHTNTPVCLGFGISSTQDIKAAKKIGADGVICGSAIVKIIEKYENDLVKMTEELKTFVGKLVHECKNN